MTGRDDHATGHPFGVPDSDMEPNEYTDHQRRAKARSPYWHGMLCADTRDEIADRMRDVLSENYFTLVCCNSYREDSDRFSSVEVHPSQWLTAPIGPYTDTRISGIGWATPRLSMGIQTDAKTQADGRQGGPHSFVCLTFEPGRFWIDHYAPAGYRLLWIFGVERHNRED